MVGIFQPWQFLMTKSPTAWDQEVTPCNIRHAYRRYRGDMIEMFKLNHGLYGTQAVEDFLDLKPSRARVTSIMSISEGAV